VDYKFIQQANGGMPFRIPLPLGIHNPGGRFCADGLFGKVMMVYYDWKICGDMVWLMKIWPSVKTIKFASIHPTRIIGITKDGRFHTLDMELFEGTRNR
jgi:hypothetical protein